MRDAEWIKAWQARAQVYAFLGNSMLKAMSEDASSGLALNSGTISSLRLANENMERSLAALEKAAGFLTFLPDREHALWWIGSFTRRRKLR